MEYAKLRAINLWFQKYVSEWKITLSYNMRTETFLAILYHVIRVSLFVECEEWHYYIHQNLS